MYVKFLSKLHILYAISIDRVEGSPPTLSRKKRRQPVTYPSSLVARQMGTQHRSCAFSRLIYYCQYTHAYQTHIRHMSDTYQHPVNPLLRIGIKNLGGCLVEDCHYYSDNYDIRDHVCSVVGKAVPCHIHSLRCIITPEQPA